jgi:hypothetical protein
MSRSKDNDAWSGRREWERRILFSVPYVPICCWWNYFRWRFVDTSVAAIRFLHRNPWTFLHALRDSFVRSWELHRSRPSHRCYPCHLRRSRKQRRVTSWFHFRCNASISSFACNACTNWPAGQGRILLGTFSD